MKSSQLHMPLLVACPLHAFLPIFCHLAVFHLSPWSAGVQRLPPCLGSAAVLPRFCHGSTAFVTLRRSLFFFVFFFSVGYDVAPPPPPPRPVPSSPPSRSHCLKITRHVERTHADALAAEAAASRGLKARRKRRRPRRDWNFFLVVLGCDAAATCGRCHCWPITRGAASGKQRWNGLERAHHDAERRARTAASQRDLACYGRSPERVLGTCGASSLVRVLRRMRAG